MRNNRDSSTKAGWLQWILTATRRDEAASYENDLTKAVPKPKLPKSVGDPHSLIGRWLTELAAWRVEQLGKFRTSFRMPWHDYGQ
jgi:hypothetical protein